MTEKEKLIESLRLEVICPAKSRMFLRADASNALIHGKSDTDDVRTHYKWSALFGEAELSFEDELCKLVKSEIGEEYDVIYDYFQSYMHHFTSYRIVPSEEARSLHGPKSYSYSGSYIRPVGTAVAKEKTDK